VTTARCCTAQTPTCSTPAAPQQLPVHHAHTPGTAAALIHAQRVMSRLRKLHHVIRARDSGHAHRNTHTPPAELQHLPAAQSMSVTISACLREVHGPVARAHNTLWYEPGVCSSQAVQALWEETTNTSNKLHNAARCIAGWLPPHTAAHCPGPAAGTCCKWAGSCTMDMFCVPLHTC
jgi:hypothetical protein